MAYLGNDLQVAFPVYRNIDDISGSFNSSTTSFPLRVSGVAPVPAPLYSQQCLISVGGVVQRPDDTGSEGFRLSGGNIIFASAPTTGADFFGVILAGADYINAGGNFPSGTAAVPSITFNDDLDTGIYNSGINQVSITTGGSERLRIDSAGQIESVSLGTAAAPAFSFTTDPNSGIYSPGADQVAISTGGSGRLFVDASGNVNIDSNTFYVDAVNNRVAIGISNPLQLLHLSSSNPPITQITYQGVGAAQTGVVAGGAYTIGVDGGNGNTERLRITSAGLVGVGTSNVLGILHAKATTNGNFHIRTLPDVGGSGEGFAIDSLNDAQNSVRPIGFRATTYSFFGSGTTYATLNSTGLGVGTTSPGRTLDVAGTIRSTTGVAELDNATQYKLLSFHHSGTRTGVVSYDNTNNWIYINAEAASSQMLFGTASSERLRIDSSGRVGIGTSSPGTNLDIVVGSGTATQKLGSSSVSGGSYLNLHGASASKTWFIGANYNVAGALEFIQSTANGGTTPSSTPAMTLDSSGRLGIGTTSPVVEFEVRKNYAGPTTIKIGNTDTGGSSGSVIQLENGTAGVDLTNISTSKAGSFFALQGFGSINTSYLDFNTHIFRNQGGSTEYARITSAGRLGIGTSAPGTATHIRGTNTTTNFTISNISGLLTLQDTSTAAGAGARIAFGCAYSGTNSTGQAIIGASKEPGEGTGSDQARSSLVFHTSNFASGVRETMRLDPDGRLGIGTTGPNAALDVAVARSATVDSAIFGTTGTGVVADVNRILIKNVNTLGGQNQGVGIGGVLAASASNEAHLTFYSNPGSGVTERARIDSSGRLLVGTSTSVGLFGQSEKNLQLSSGSGATDAGVAIRSFGNNANAGGIDLIKSRGTGATNTIVQSGDNLGNIYFSGGDGTNYRRAADIQAFVEGTPATGSVAGRLVFSTTADGASSPTERMRITNAGATFVGKTSSGLGTAGVEFFGSGDAGTTYLTRNSGDVLSVNRLTTDGQLVNFYQDTTLEGSISVSGTTVSYNGAHLSRWSQLPSDQERTEILRGSVLSNIDEMCEWNDEDNEQLNRMKVSDVEGDKNVSGVFQAWDDDDDTYTNDFYCAMTGDFIIRIGAGVTVERGDLLMSAGDGTAKPQDDDIIRSKTVAKVTSTNVSCTYPDGSYCVPCVLMAC